MMAMKQSNTAKLHTSATGVEARPNESRNREKHASRQGESQKQLLQRLQQNDEHRNHWCLGYWRIMDNIKEYCCNGDIQSAFSYSCQFGCESKPVVESFLVATRFLFWSDLYGRSGIYYAAKRGHVEMVRSFLALLVWERAFRKGCSSSTSMEVKPKTMLGWLDFFGFPLHFFSRAHFKLCLRSAANEKTRDVFIRTKFSWKQVLNMVTTLCGPESHQYQRLRSRVIRRYHQDHMEDINTACKTGDLVGALQEVASVAKLVNTPFTANVDCRLISVRMFFIIDAKENRSGIYYAANAGHAKMVQVFLALLICERVVHASDSSIATIAPDELKPTTMMGWLEHFGFFPDDFFSRDDFELCILDALNQQTKDVFNETKFSWKQLRTMVLELDGTFQNQFGDEFNLSAFVLGENRMPKRADTAHCGKNKKRPKLYMDDDFDYDVGEADMYEYDSDDNNEDELDEPCDDNAASVGLLSSSPCVCEVFTDEELQVPDDATSLCLNDLINFPFDELHASFSFAMGDLEIASDQVVCNDDLDETESQWTNVGVESVGESCLLSVHASSDGFHSPERPNGFPEKADVDEDEPSFVLAKDELSCVSSGWDEMTDTFSVMSLASQPFKKSYLEALRENQVPTVENEYGKVSNRSSKHHLPQVKEADHKEEKDDDDDGDEGLMFDAFFDSEGVKEARGGKKSRMFKGQGRKPRL